MLFAKALVAKLQEYKWPSPGVSYVLERLTSDGISSLEMVSALTEQDMVDMKLNKGQRILLQKLIASL